MNIAAIFANLKGKIIILLFNSEIFFLVRYSSIPFNNLWQGKNHGAHMHNQQYDRNCNELPPCKYRKTNRSYLRKRLYMDLQCDTINLQLVFQLLCTQEYLKKHKKFLKLCNKILPTIELYATCNATLPAIEKEFC